MIDATLYYYHDKAEGSLTQFVALRLEAESRGLEVDIDESDYEANLVINADGIEAKHLVDWASTHGITFAQVSVSDESWRRWLDARVGHLTEVVMVAA